MYHLKHFIIKELIPPETYAAEGDASLLHIDERILVTLDQVRDFYGVAVTVNNWHRSGNFKYRGYRPSTCEVGATHSMHRLGQAVDFDVHGRRADQVRAELRQNYQRFPFIRRMEDGVSWVHIDLKETGENGIQLFKV
jgi:hypothetical protein